MRVIVDTSVWIEFFKAHDPFFSRLKQLIEEQQAVAVECAFGELLQGSKNKKERKTIIEYWDNLPKINEGGLWIEAGLNSSLNKWLDNGVGLIDALLITFSRRNNLQVWSLDKKLLKQLDEVEKFTHTG